MVHYTPYLPKERDALKDFHRAFQALICILAHKNLRIDIDQIEGIFKYEGGVIVGQKEICIKQDHLFDDSDRSHDPTITELAVKSALEELHDKIDFDSVQDSIENIIIKLEVPEQEAVFHFVVYAMCDPLRAFFGK